MHRLIDEAAFAGLVALLEGGEQADEEVHTGVGVAEGGTALGRNIIFAFIPAGSRSRCGCHLCNRFVGFEVFVFRRFREALDCTVDTFGVEFVDHIPAETEFIHCSGVEVFDKHIGFLNQFCQDSFAVGGFRIERNRFFVRVELQEVITWQVGIELEFLTGCVADARTFDFDYLSAKPREHLST